MAISLLNFQPQTRPSRPHCNHPVNSTPKTSHFTASPKSQFKLSFTNRNARTNCFLNSNLKPLSELSSRSTPKDVKLADTLKHWVRFIQSASPGGSWWNLYSSKEVESRVTAAKSSTVFNALRRMWVLVADDKWVILIAFSSLTIAALSEISIPNLLATSIFSAESGETLVFYKNSQLLALLCITSGICSGLRSGCFAIVNMNLLKCLRESLYEALILQDISFFDTETVGDLSSRLGADCQRLSHVIGNDVHLILRNAIQGMGALINLLTLSLPLALSTLVICSVLSAIFLVYGQYKKKAAKLTQEFTACANEVLGETLSSMRTIRIYGTEMQELGRYKQWLDKLAFIHTQESAAYGFWTLSFNTIYRLTQVFAVVLGGMSILTGHATPEQLTKYVLYCEWLIYAAWRVEDNFTSLLQSVGATEKVFQLMDLLPGDQFLLKGLKLQRLMGHIEFVDVSFNYPSRVKVPILEHVSMSVQANEVVAIVGISGSGKSTLVNLLLRLYEPIQGQIFVDGIPLKELDVRWLRQHIGYVGQEPHLLRMDIKSNISYGCSRDINQEDVERAAKQAFCDEFISALPGGYETIVDDDLLSGGQKQRIAIARAILRDPPILILDEATSALDAESEYNMQGILQGFRNVTRAKRTVIVIAHRLSTVRAADRIIVMEGGRVVEMGKHEELIGRNGLYTKLNRMQKDASLGLSR